MKKICFSLVVLFLGLGLFSSCSKEETTSSSSSVSENAKVVNYLNSFYAKNYVFGKSVNAKFSKPTDLSSATLSKTVEVEDVKITEILVGDDVRARGYVVTSKETNAFLYFADVDRDSYKMITSDITANSSLTLKNIDQLEKYYATNEFDMIKVTEEYIAEQTNIEGKRRFWGW